MSDTAVSTFSCRFLPFPVLSLFLPFFVSFSGYWLGFILVRKVENLLGSEGRKYRRLIEQDFHWNFRVNCKWFFAFFSSVLDWIVFIVVLFERYPPPPPAPPAQVRWHSTREFKLHVYGKRQTDVRFKLRVSQNRKLADKNSSKQFLSIKNCVKLLIYA